ncbi:MAG: class I SAM-dependent methyltransferase [Nitrospira sp.]|nr:class I SAM-dependent methyltransferase [Nitrospira sp.]
MDASIVDVGCGKGRNLALLRGARFLNLMGVDVNPMLVHYVKEKGEVALTNEEFVREVPPCSVDVLLMSHIVEHFDHRALLEFLATCLDKLKVGGTLIVVTPLMSGTFYNDFDHIRPYLPIGFTMVFGRTTEQVQYQSDHVLALEDLRFYRAPFRIQWHRALYVPGQATWPIWINRVFRLLFLLSRGSIGVQAGWIGKFRYEGRRQKQYIEKRIDSPALT